MMNKQEELEYEATLGLTSTAAVDAVENRYDLVLIGARRARELGRGDMPKMTGPKHSAVVTALKDIDHGNIGRDYLYRSQNLDFKRPR